MANDDDSSLVKGRKTSLLNMAAKVALKQGKNFIYRATEDKLKNMVSQADVIVQHVGQLKGAAMKAVQMITIEGQDFLPPEVLKVLQTLQSQSRPLSNEKMIERLRDELGDAQFSRLEDLGEAPIAAASIGQVYRARIDGRPVVVKVQYPEIAESVDSDLAILRKLIKGLMFLSQKKVDMDDLFDEVTRILKLETDYLNEMNALNLYREAFKDLEGYVIPSVYPEFTTSRVITMSFEEGMEFADWVETQPGKDSRNRVGSRLLDLYQLEFFRNKLVQTDPNPANFLVNKNDEVVLLDFGATISYDQQFVDQYSKLLQSVFSGEGDLYGTLMELGFLDPRESDEIKKEFVDFLKVSLTPFEPDQQPFDFASEEYVTEVRSRAISFSRNIKYSAPPKQIIFLHRKLGGIFQLLRMLKAQVDLTPFVESILIPKEKSR